MSVLSKKDYVLKIIEILDVKYKDIEIALHFKDTFQLLVATILSAQCTDERVNAVTPAIFKKYKSVKDYANANLDEMKELVYSTGFYQNKAKNIIKTAQIITEKFNSKVPDTMEDLLSLAGVARKTANVVLGHAYNKAGGVVVDTHVKRIAKILKLTKSDDPLKIEKDLNAVVAQKFWVRFPILIQALGRTFCKARNPNCSLCPIKKLCPVGLKKKDQ